VWFKSWPAGISGHTISSTKEVTVKVGISGYGNLQTMTIEQVKKVCMDFSRYALNSMLQAKTLYHTEKQGFGYLWL